MSTNGIKVLETTALTSLRKWFGTKPGATKMTPAEIYAAENLDPTLPSSKRWLSNKLSAMRHYGLFERQYDESSKSIAKRLLTISLTPKGKEALGAGGFKETEARRPEDVTPDTVLRDVRILRKKMPLWNVIFELRPKDED